MTGPKPAKLVLLVDTCVWLDLAKDRREQPTLAALEDLAKRGDVQLVVPQIVIDAKFPRIIGLSCSLSDYSSSPESCALSGVLAPAAEAVARLHVSLLQSTPQRQPFRVNTLADLRVMTPS